MIFLLHYFPIDFPIGFPVGFPIALFSPLVLTYLHFPTTEGNNFMRNLEQIWLRNLIRVSVAHININSDRNEIKLL